MSPKDLNKLLFHARRLYEVGSAELEHHWTQSERCAAELLAQPAGPEQLALRRLLEEFQAACAARSLPANMVVIERELERVAALGSSARAAQPADPTPVAEVAALLKGRAVLVIGGLPRPEHKANLERSFGLSELVWPLSREQKPDVPALEPHVARPDVVVVLLLIRWIRHALGDVASLCARHDKPLVRVPGGYNADTLAPLILAQAGKRLGA